MARTKSNNGMTMKFYFPENIVNIRGFFGRLNGTP